MVWKEKESHGKRLQGRGGEESCAHDRLRAGVEANPLKFEETMLAFLDCIKTSAELFANVESLTFTVPLEYTT